MKLLLEKNNSLYVLFLFIFSGLSHLGYSQYIAAPIFDSVSVNHSTGLIQLGWTASPTTGVDQYLIQEYDPDINVVSQTLDTAYNTTTHSIPASLIDANTTSFYFTIAARNSTNKETSNYTFYQKNMVLKTPVSDPCKETVTLEWTPYVHMINGLNYYIIFGQINNTPFQPIDTVDATLTTYTHQGVIPGNGYTYFIRAVNKTNTITASSNLAKTSIQKTAAPAKAALIGTTVDENGYVSLHFSVDNSTPIARYDIFRGNPNDTLDFLLSVQNKMTSPSIYLDNTAYGNEKAYAYRIHFYDACQETYTPSNIATTVFLTGIANLNSNTLYWTPYQDSITPINFYKIYRYMEGYPLVIGQVDSQDKLTFTDDIQYMPVGNNYLYQIKAVDVFGNEHLIGSNWVPITQKPRIFVPNAFVPDGINRAFLPLVTFININKYELIIWNRWGQKIFETDQTNISWDGTFKGADCPGGVYNYLITYFDDYNGKQLIRGSVTLIR